MNSPIHYYSEMKVLIYLPVFNDEKRIARAINSVATQSHSNWQLLISDNSSTDNTLDFVKPYLNDPRIICKSLNVHVSAAANFNSIANLISDTSEFDLVCFMASDDYWGDENHLKNLINNFIANYPRDAVKLVLPIYSSVSNSSTSKSWQIKIKASSSFYPFRILHLFRIWGTVNLVYGLYEKDFFIDVLNSKFSRLTNSNPYTDWWWTYLVLKKTSPVLCLDSLYYKDNYKNELPKKISRVENLILTLRFMPDFFRDKLLLIRGSNFHDYLMIFIFAFTKTVFDLLLMFRRTIKRILKVKN